MQAGQPQSTPLANLGFSLSLLPQLAHGVYDPRQWKVSKPRAICSGAPKAGKECTQVKRHFLTIVAVGLCCVIGLLVTGCEDDEDGPAVDVTGTWLFNNYAGQRTTGNLVQNGGVVSGSIGNGQASGTISEYYLEVTVNHPDRLIFVRADVSRDGATMEGDWRFTNSQGTFGATRR